MRHTTRTFGLVFFLGLLLAAPLRADAGADAPFVVGAKVGLGVGTGPLGAGFTPELELGYVLPFLEGRISAFLGLRYAGLPSKDALPVDPRLPGSQVHEYTLLQEEAILTLGGRTFFELTDSLSAYGLLGARLYLMRTRIRGDIDGIDPGENLETGTSGGFVLGGGVEWALGPGHLVGELAFGYAPLDGLVFQETNTGMLSLNVGYRFYFGL
ncbi:MAG: outer membrane beta-barrel protein [Deltaproteobacteria bacterium]|nr:outer membrane beta-barrel protein [Deltaproteobacteria bacterium]